VGENGKRGLASASSATSASPATSATSATVKGEEDNGRNALTTPPAIPPPLRHAHSKAALLNPSLDPFRAYGSLKGDSARPVLDNLGSGDLTSYVLKRGRVKRMFGIRAGAAGVSEPSSRLSVFPPLFDSRLFYRSCHRPLKIEDQGACASCVFISAAYVAQIRANISLLGVSAVDLWRQQLRAGYADAACAFTNQMSSRAATPQHPNTPAPIPLLDWKRFICCHSEQDVSGACASRLDYCYHHQDGDPDESVFTCEKSITGVVPHHFVEWVARRGFHDLTGRPVISKIRPEGEGDSEVSPFSVTRSVDATEIDEKVALAIAEQVRAIKVSLMANGPLMVMMRIHGNNFDEWGKKKGLRLGYTLPASGQMDEYHEVMLVGWSVDDAGRPCWIVQNSYGPNFNDSCAVSPDADLPLDPETKQTLARAYDQAELGSGGFVFVRMVDTEMIEKDIGSGLENNALAFIPIPNMRVLTMPTAPKVLPTAPTRSGGEMKLAQRVGDDHAAPEPDHSDVYAYVTVAAVILAIVILAYRINR
jgi:hypothetical protein